jgi:hypothetical protein
MATAQFEKKDKSKYMAIIALYAVSALIVVSGLAFGVYSWYFHVSYTVFNTDISGMIVAAVIVFLGARYFRSVQKMNKRLQNTKDHFNWNNFKFSHSRTKKMEG